MPRLLPHSLFAVTVLLLLFIVVESHHSFHPVSDLNLGRPALHANFSPRSCSFCRGGQKHEMLGGMWKLVESFSAALLGPEEESQRRGTMDNRPSSTPSSLVLGNVDGERVVEKLKGYFSLGKGEIDKAVRADEWGLLEDALLHYSNANRILLEGIALPAMVESSRCVMMMRNCDDISGCSSGVFDGGWS